VLDFLIKAINSSNGVLVSGGIRYVRVLLLCLSLYRAPCSHVNRRRLAICRSLPDRVCRCLVVFSEDITDDQLTRAVPVLFPALLKVLGAKVGARAGCWLLAGVRGYCCCLMATCDDPPSEPGRSPCVVGQGFASRVHARCLTIYRKCIESMNTITDEENVDEVLQELLIPTLGQFMQVGWCLSVWLALLLLVVGKGRARVLG